jgi:large subunit ribosomal protein L18
MKRSVPTIKYRRKREQKTNYRKRLTLLKSGKNRLVIRKSNKYIMLQVVRYEPQGDNIIKICNSNELAKFGWKFSFKNVQAAYLTGLLIAQKMKTEKNKEVIVDFGLSTPLKGYNKLYSVVKGAIDGGLSIPVGEGIFPDEEKLAGKDDVKKSFEEIKKKLLS